MSDSEVDGDLSPTLSELSGLLTSRTREDGYDSNGETQVSFESVSTHRVLKYITNNLCHTSLVKA